MSKFIPLSVPNLCGNEAAYCQKAIASEWVSTGGAYITEFEEKIAAYVGTPGAVACQSGTAGLHLALLSCGVGQNDEVLVPTLTFIAAVNPVKYVGAEPVFMDCDDTLCMDMQKVERFCETECAMTPEGLLDKATGRYVRAMLVVHVFGNLADLDKAAALAEKYDLALIEDATEALGSRYLSGRFAGRFAGTVGKVGVYSFNGNKIITTGGGGMLVSGDEAILREAKYLSTQAKDDTLYFVHNHIGYNYRMTNLQAALGLAQLEKLEDFIRVKAENYRAYFENGIELLPFRDDIRTNHWFYSFMTDRRDELIRALSERAIQSRPVWHLIADLPPYQNCRAYEIARAQYYWQHIVNLPCSTNLTKEDVAVVAKAVHDILK